MGQIKIINFKTSVMVNEAHGSRKTRGASAYYMSPEALNYRFDPKGDIWSAGVIMYIMICGQPPFYGKDENEVKSLASQSMLQFTHKTWNSVSEDAKMLLMQLLTKNAADRPTAAQALTHRWF